MYNLHLVIGPVQVGLETDEKLSFDGIEINTPHDYLLWKNNNGMKDGDQ